MKEKIHFEVEIILFHGKYFLHMPSLLLECMKNISDINKVSVDWATAP